MICTTRSPRTHWARSLSFAQMQTFSTRGVFGGEVGGRGEGVVSFELDHRPDCDSHRGERILEREKLRVEHAIDSLARLVVRPELVAEGLDHVVGGHADMGRAGLDHLQHGVQHASNGAEWFVFSLVPAALAVEVAEKLVGAVDQVNDHFFWRFGARFNSSRMRASSFADRRCCCTR